MGQILTTDAIRNTYVRLLIERFINVASQIRKENIPQQVNQDSLDYVADSNVVLGFITEFFDITKDEKDVISSSSLYNDFRMKGVSNKTTSSKFKDNMTNIQGN